MDATADMELCTGCGACVEACPVEAIILRDGKVHVDGDKCGVCVGACPNDAISME
jgi:ferredoxin